MEQEAKTKTKQENIVAGVVGAFLGSLIGVVCAVVIGQMGYVASISGLIMAVGALKGYELLGGGLSKKGAVISSVLVLVMTWLAHRLTWAVAVALTVDANVFDCFRAIPALLEQGALEGREYWADLAMLYLFTLVGAVPTIMAGLRGASMPAFPQGAPAPAAQDGEAPDTAFYPGELKWMRPLRMSATLAMLVVIVPMVLLLILGIANNAALTYTLASLGCIAALLVMVCLVMPSIQLCNYAMLLLVRVNGVVWKVSLAMLNPQDTYRFTKKIGVFRAVNWDMLDEEERARAKVSVLRAISLLSSGQVMPGSALGMAVCPLSGLQVVQEDRWKWKCTYSVANGREKKLTIPKAYPGFVPVPGMEPAQGPVPARWGLLGLAAAVTVVLGLIGGGFGYQLDFPVTGGRTPSPAPTQTAQPEETQPSEAQSQVPELVTPDPRAMFHLGTELGYSFTGVGYIQAPDGMYGPGSYLDAHVPFSDAPEYLDGGHAIRSAAHGMEVTVTIAQSEENAMDVVDRAYAAMEDAGTDLYHSSETEYSEEYDIAVKQVLYFEENQTKVRVAVLYADYKRDGYYLSASIVYQTELLDDDYPQLLAELSDAYALNLPEIEPMDF